MIASPSSRREWDVVVVGAGPAGACAARTAAQAGRTVLLLERASIPRYKTCGGGLAGGSLAELPPELELDVKEEVEQVTPELERPLGPHPAISGPYRQDGLPG